MKYDQLRYKYIKLFCLFLAWHVWLWHMQRMYIM